MLGLEAPAKLNLSLAVMGRRPDGYHELAGVMTLLELHDGLRLTRGDGSLDLEPDADAESAPAGADNLAWRGLAAGMGAAPKGVRLTLRKRIPVAAGLGGGSSDAAAALRLGAHAAGRDADAMGLTEAAAIGADVPFFLARTAVAFVTGVGERVEPLTAVATRHVVLAVPSFGLSTAAVFAELKPSDWSRQEPQRSGEPGQNDLAAAAFRMRPALADVFEAFRGAGSEPHLTGSGSACFTLTEDAERAGHVAAALERTGLRVIRTATRLRAAEIEEDNGEQRGA